MFINNLINYRVLSGKTIRSFNADEEVNELITAANLKKGQLTGFLNDKIKKGVIYESQLNKIEEAGEIIVSEAR